ncbi:hypothetical protein BOX15_Mlig001891g1 [Macrostomum lignano]|uniref:Large ribosomal subunit protein mL40 n=1 Tax=Macrostomum lignano TaxID=282301 RepID=A0A267EHX0_9PLAT|nr:hypothetical protein BOX15_Mlig001891g1 [Macrostomum lignano]
MLTASIRHIFNYASFGSRNFHLSVVLPAEPLKKKKRVDPQVELERIRKKTRRIEKEIKRLEQRGRYLKPLDEIEGERHFIKTLDSRERKLPAPSETEVEQRALLMKEWTRFKWRQLDTECQLLANQRRELYRAMQHLRMLDPSLFELATQPDESLLGLSLSGPLYTLPQSAEVFDAVDGDYRDVTPTYRYTFEVDKKMTFGKKK